MWPMLKKHPIIPHNFQDLNGVLKWETSHKGSWVSRMTASACGRVSVKSLWISAAGSQHNRPPATGLLELNSGAAYTHSSPDNHVRTELWVSAWSPGQHKSSRELQTQPQGLAENRCFISAREVLHWSHHGWRLKHTTICSHIQQQSRETDSACHISSIKIDRDKTAFYPFINGCTVHCSNK